MKNVKLSMEFLILIKCKKKNIKCTSEPKTSCKCIQFYFHYFITSLKILNFINKKLIKTDLYF